MGRRFPVSVGTGTDASSKQPEEARSKIETVPLLSMALENCTDRAFEKCTLDGGDEPQDGVGAWLRP